MVFFPNRVYYATFANVLRALSALGLERFVWSVCLYIYTFEIRLYLRRSVGLPFITRFKNAAIVEQKIDRANPISKLAAGMSVQCLGVGWKTRWNVVKIDFFSCFDVYSDQVGGKYTQRNHHVCKWSLTKFSSKTNKFWNGGVSVVLEWKYTSRWIICVMYGGGAVEQSINSSDSSYLNLVLASWFEISYGCRTCYL